MIVIATRVKTFLHPYIYYMASERLQGEKQFHSMNYLLEVVNMRVQIYVFTRAAIKIKIFYSCRTGVVRVALVPHWCRSCNTYVARISLVSLVSHSCRLCRTRVARIWHSCCKLV